MRWEKLGHVYVADGEGWARSHAYLPTSILLGETIRVFVAFLDPDGIGRVGYVDVAADDPVRVLGVSSEPALDIGAPGMFDEHGVSPLSVAQERDGRLRLYYLGWQRAVGVRYFMFTGLAVSDDSGASFRRVQRTPVLERSDAEPMTRSGALVMRSGDRWRAWYLGGDSWVEQDGKALPTYSLRYLESDDGIDWGPSGGECFAPRSPDEFGFGRATLFEQDGLLRMWYSIRSHSRGYRIGYAESRDGRAWNRRDELAGIDVSASGWDCEAIGPGWIQETPRARYLFYNGNRYGETGFGVAVLSETS